MRPDFKKSKELANILLTEQDLTCPVTDVRNFTYDHEVIFVEMHEFCSRYLRKDYDEVRKTVFKDGCTVYDKLLNSHTVIYDLANSLRLYYTLAHEVGHIQFGHCVTGDEIAEAEANAFANQLLMPEYSILMAAQEHGWINYRAVSEIFGVSPTAARNRLASLKRRRGIHVTADDKEIYERQRDRIELYYECLRTGKSYRNALYLREDHADEIALNRMREQMMAFANDI